MNSTSQITKLLGPIFSLTPSFTTQTSCVDIDLASSMPVGVDGPLDTGHWKLTRARTGQAIIRANEFDFKSRAPREDPHLPE